jgi:glycosyltransferase involved in cell wall biosynthesis
LTQLKIAIVSAQIHPKYGGPPSVIQAHRESLVSHAIVKIFGGYDASEQEELGKLYPGSELFPLSFPKRWFRAVGLRKALAVQAGDFDVFHAHMLWDHATWAAWQAARVAGKALIVTPHGNIINTGRWKPAHKGLYRQFVLDPLFEETTFLHALNKREEQACHALGVKCSIRVIPNGLPELAYRLERQSAQALERWPKLKNRRVLLFMGRVAPLKGLDLLPEAWGGCLRQSGNKDWVLAIAGPDYRGFTATVRRQIEELDLEGQTLLTGPVYGPIKDSLLSCAEAFVLPSHTEGFSIALLEAIAARLPCLYRPSVTFRS